MLLRLALAAPLVFLTSCIIPDDAQPGVGVGVGVVSRHMHRGMVQNERGGAQTHVDIDLPTKALPGLQEGRVDLSIWGNADLSDDTGDSWFPDGHEGRFTEIRGRAAYTQQVGPVALQGGVFTYVLPNGPEFPFGERGQTSEIFLTASGEVLGAVPSFSFRYDFDEAESIYLLAALSESFPINDLFQVRARGWTSYSGEGMSFWNYGLRQDGLADLGGELALDYFFDDRTTFEVKLGGSTLLDGGLRNWFNVLGIDSDNIWVGGAVRFRF